MKPGLRAPVVRIVFMALAVLPVLFVACKRDSSETAPPPPPPAPPASASLEKILVHSAADDRVVVTLRWNEEEVQILWGSGEQKRLLRARLGPARQRRYTERGVGPVALVRSNPELPGFTLRTVDGEIKWRARLGKKIVLFENHEDKAVFELRRPNDKLVRAMTAANNEICKVRFPNGRVRVHDPADKLIYKVTRKAPASALYGLLAVPQLDEVDRYILMAELLVRDR